MRYDDSAPAEPVTAGTRRDARARPPAARPAPADA
jgi:hypothetical protein